MVTHASGIPLQIIALRERLLAESSAPTRLWITQQARRLASSHNRKLCETELERAISQKLAGRFLRGSQAEGAARSVLEFLILTELEDNRQAAQTAFQAADQRTTQLMNILATILKTMDQERGTINNALH
jgi:hypothetical protein